MKNLCVLSYLFCTAFTAYSVAAERNSDVIPYWACFQSAADEYQINPLLLAAIAEQESAFNPQAINTKKGKAVGLMQIHSQWFSILDAQGIDEQALYDACTNIRVGAWVLAQKIVRYGETWRAVGSYFAGTGIDQHIDQLRSSYATSVARRYQRLARRLL